MKNNKLYLVILAILLLSACEEKKPSNAISAKAKEKENIHKTNKIQVLNFGIFHMGFTPDATSVEFDEKDKENQKRVHEIAIKIAAFKPTLILVETVPEYDEKLQAEYNEYLKNPNMFFKEPGEIELLAYEVGRLGGTKRIYGIDHKMEYNYMIGSEIENEVDSIWYNRFYKNPFKYFPEVNVNEDSLSLLEKIKLNNHARFLDFAISINADMLTHAGSEKGFEGADEAAKFYLRNLRMYTNLNRIELNENDRVFILMGAAHTAFFKEFMSRSPKYEMVNNI